MTLPASSVSPPMQSLATVMTDHPIIFSAPMVRALLNGRKTMTRRIISKRNCEFGSIPNGKLTDLFWQHANWSKAWPDRGFLHVPCHDPGDGSVGCDLCMEWGWDSTSHRLYPRISPGDRLWVRENFFIPDAPYEAKKAHLVSYKADETSELPLKYTGWRSSMRMPRWASRLTLIVSAVKIESLQKISEGDAAAEGICRFTSGSDHLYGIPCEGGYEECGLTARESFMNVWCSLHGPAAWADNPHVVALTINQMPKAEAA